MSGARKRWKRGQGVYGKMLASNKDVEVVDSIKTGIYCAGIVD